MDRSADQHDPPTAGWPSITDYWPEVSPDHPAAAADPAAAAAPAAVPGPPEPQGDGFTWIGPPETETDPVRRRWRIAVGGILAAAVLVAAGVVLDSLIKQAHETTTTAEPVSPPHSAGTLTAPLAPTGAASVAPASVAPAPSSVSAAPSASIGVAKGPAPLVPLPGTATFELAAGSPSVTLQTRDLGTRLYQATVAKGAAGDPAIADDGSVHRLTVTHDGKAVAVPLTITLNAKVHWTFRVTGGIKQNVLNLRDSDLTAIELAEGASKTRLTLPPATGTLPVRVTHGVHTLQINPDGTDPVRTQIRAGADKVALLGEVDDGVAKGTVLTSPGFSTATDRIDVIATGGIGTLTVS